MAKQTINIGATPNDGTGTPLRTSFDYCNQNFTELYTATGPSGNNIVVPGSATITGDLTVDTSTLKVDATNHRVGIGTASPGKRCEINQSANAITTIGSGEILRLIGDDGNTNSRITEVGFGTGPTGATFAPVIVGAVNTSVTGFGTKDFYVATRAGVADVAPLERYRIDATGISTWSVAGTTAMTLNSTGLGVGGVPSYKLDVQGTSAGVLRLVNILNLSTDPAAVTRLSLDGQGATWHLDNERTNGIFKITRNSTACLTIDNSGNVGVGVTPSVWGSAFKPVQLTYGSLYSQAFTVAGVAANCYNAGAGGWTYFGSGQTASRYEQSVGTHAWYTAVAGTGAIGTFTQAMTLDASGNLLVGTTSNSPAGTQSQFVNQWSGGAKWGSTFNQTVSSATAYTHIAFCTNGAVRGSIDANNTTITYGTVSDYRLKENVQPISNALTRIAALKPSTYKWKDSGTDGEGFIAHELAAVVPLAVVGQKDAVNEDGSIKAQQIDLSKVVPILVAAIQELTARVQTLEAK